MKARLNFFKSKWSRTLFYKHISLLSLIIFTCGTLYPQVNLDIAIENIEYQYGNLHLAVFSSETKFLKAEGALKKTFKKVTSDKLDFKFSLPKNTYAIAVFHDLNGNGKHDKTILGIPKEPFCFSNNVVHKLATPGFEKCNFYLDQDKTLTLTLIN